jgi:hypothetical protein
MNGWLSLINIKLIVTDFNGLVETYVPACL